MTHTPTLTNGFSRDFSEAPRDDYFFVWYVARFGEEWVVTFTTAYFDEDGHMAHMEDQEKVSSPLCWCPIPTPGDAVLKELAEEGK